jgi:hypothetical protein
MLYREPNRGWRRAWLQLIGGRRPRSPHFADLDLLSMNGHLRRDIGLGENLADLRRK